jgi:uncharacterized protein (TIGR02145 family)
MKKTFYVWGFALCSLFVLPITAQVPGYVPTEGLIAFYPFQGNANDASGNGYNCLTQNVTNSDDRFGNENGSYYFNQNAFALNTSYNIGSNPGFSASTWFKVSSGTEGGHLWDIRSNQRSFSLFNSNAGFTFRVWDYDLLFDLATNIYSFDEWHNVTITSNFIDDTRIYLDGELRSQIGIAVPVPSNVSLFYIGRHGLFTPPMGALLGSIDDIAIYNRALSEEEINAIYTGVPIDQEPLFQTGGGVTDIDGNTYSTVLINNQEWMSENLNVSSFCNGDPITNASDWPEWFNIVEPRRCAYEANEAYRDQFGSLYNFWAVRDERNLCPCGWHVPSLAEYQSLETYLGGNEIAAGKIKGVETWVGENVGDLNASGLNMLAGGNVADNFYSSSIGSGTTIWLSTSVEGVGGHFADFRGDRTWAYIDAVYPMEGFYVRCIRDSDNSQIGGCTDLLACNYSDTATVDDGTCQYVGSACNDGSSLTVDDSINENCNCSGTTLPAICTSLPSNLQQGLVGYWPFCGNANDESGNGNDGVVNGATLTEDRFGNTNAAFQFNGINSVINVPSSQSLNIEDNLTISAWIYRDNSESNDGEGIFGPSNFLPDSPGFYFRIIDKKVDLGLSSPYTEGFSNQEISGDNWYHIVGTYNNNDINIYVNGLLDNSTFVGSENLDQWVSSGDLTIGKEAYQGAPEIYHQFNGSLDDIGIWNRALTPEEVQELYTLDACTFTVYDTLTVFETVYDTVYTYETIYDTVTTYISVTDTLIIDVVLGIEPTGSSNTLLLYPNPASSQLTIDYGNFATMAGYTLTIFDSAGSTVHSTAVFQQQETLDLASWSSGAYQVIIYNAQGVPIDMRTIIIQ